MKSYHKLIVLAVISCFFFIDARAQLKIGTEGIYIKAGTILATDGLIINPSADLSLAGLSIEKSNTPLTGTTGSGINRVYDFSTPVTFSGTLGVYYLAGELNGNAENLLQFVYKSSGAAPSFTTTTAAVVNTTTKYLSGSFTGTTFSKLSAADPASFAPNADLSALALNNGILAPSFVSGTIAYTASVINSVSSLTVTPVSADNTSTITVNGTAVTSGNASQTISLNVGSNTITTVVTASDRSTIKTYTVTVTREASSNANLLALSISSGTLSPAFMAGTTGYTAAVSNGIKSIAVSPTIADTTATITVNGTAVISGSVSNAISLNVGSNTLNTVITAQDGTIQTYTITITRAASSNADLSAITISSGTLSPVFAAGTADYTASVGNAITSITVMPAIADSTATVTVNGIAVTSGSASGAIPLNVGNNTLTTVITAQDGTTTKNYTIMLTRLASQEIVFAAPPKIYGDVDFTLPATASSGLPISYISDNTSVATITGNTVTIKNAGTVKITASQAGNANYEPASSVEHDLIVDKKAITITAASKGKTFGDADPALTYLITSGALIGMDTFTGSLDRAAGENTGTYAIGQGTLALSTNYILSYTGADLTIGQRAITVTAASKSKTYGETDPVFTYTFSPELISGDAFAGTLSRTAGENTGTYAIGQGTLALSTNYVLSYTGADLTIGQRAITVTAASKSKTYGEADPVFTYTFSPELISGDAFAGTLSRTAGENIGSYAIGQGTLALGTNYVLSYTGADLTIGQRAITVTAASKSKTYGEADPVFTYTFSPELISGDAFTGTLSRTAGENTGTYAIGQGTLALSTNYVLSYTGADLTIGQRTITVTAASKSKTYGETDPVFTYTFSPELISGDAFAGTLSRTAGENIGSYEIGQGTLALSTNYVLSYTGADLTIGQRAIIVTAASKSKTYGETDPVFNYTFSPELISGDAFTGTLSRTAGENIGSYAIEKSTLVLNGNYVLSYNSANLTIAAKQITITADPKSKIYGDTDPPLTYTYAPALAAGDAFTGSLNRLIGENADTYTIDQNTLTLNANYMLNYKGANLIINKKQLTITADAKNKLFNTGNPPLTASYSGFAGTENSSVLSSPAVLNTSATLASPSGNYPIVVSAATAANYAINFIQGTLTVTANNQVITFAALADKLSTDLPFNLIASSTSGLTISYTSSDPDVVRIINGDQAEILKAGNVIITASQSGDSNYTAALPVTRALQIIDNLFPAIVITSNLGNDIRKGDVAILTATGALTYVWTNANGMLSGQNTAQLTVRPSVSTTYTVTGTNQYGRAATKTITLTVKEDLTAVSAITATNLISPNGDGVNDYFIVKNIDLYPNNKITIFDRAGKIIYKVNGYKNDWNGSINGLSLEVGTYYYMIDFGDGKTTAKKGFITLLKD
jgi:gliding motility-associated-like protein